MRLPRENLHDQRHDRVDFQNVKNAARPVLRAILRRVLPGGREVNGQYVVRNPRRRDRTPGSFMVRLRDGIWRDFATDDGGGDIISLVAFVEGVSQVEAPRLLAQLLNLGGAHGRR
jgi:hypothetical protein